MESKRVKGIRGDLIILVLFMLELILPTVLKSFAMGIHVLGLDVLVFILKLITIIAVLYFYGGFLKNQLKKFDKNLLIRLNVPKNEKNEYSIGLRIINIVINIAICVLGYFVIEYIIKFARDLVAGDTVTTSSILSTSEVMEYEDEDVFDYFTASVPMLGLVLMTSFAPVFSALTEEIIFRYMLFYKHKKGIAVSFVLLIISSILFGAIHYFNFNSFSATIPYMLVAFYFGLIYWLSKNIWYSIIIHFMNNFMLSVYPVITLIKLVLTLR